MCAVPNERETLPAPLLPRRALAYSQFSIHNAPPRCSLCHVGGSRPRGEGGETIDGTSFVEGSHRRCSIHIVIPRVLSRSIYARFSEVICRRTAPRPSASGSQSIRRAFAHRPRPVEKDWSGDAMLAIRDCKWMISCRNQ